MSLVIDQLFLIRTLGHSDGFVDIRTLVHSDGIVDASYYRMNVANKMEWQKALYSCSFFSIDLIYRWNYLGNLFSNTYALGFCIRVFSVNFYVVFKTVFQSKYSIKIPLRNWLKLLK